MNCQVLFSGKNKKNISTCRLLKNVPRVLSVNTHNNLLYHRVVIHDLKIGSINIFSQFDAAGAFVLYIMLLINNHL